MTYLPPDHPDDGRTVDAPAREPKLAPESVLVAPRNPVTRWNRRYLAVGAAGIAALVAAGFYIGFGGAHRPAPKAPADPSKADVAPTTSPIAARYAKGYGDPAVQSLGAPGTVSLPPPGTTPVGAPVAQAAAPPPRPVDPAVQQAQEQARAARSASPFFASAGVSETPPAGPVLVPVATGPSPAGATMGAEVLPANGQGAKRQFMAGAKADDYLATPLRGPQSPWEVKAGTIIPAALITAINSDLPGEIIAQVTEPVYDHVTGRTVLIPQGARLIGQYDSQVAYGQARALIAWNRIVMPDGRSINIGSMAGADLSGAAGLKDQVDGHFWQMARGIALSTLFTIGASSAQDASARSSGNLVINSAASGVATETQSVGQQVTGRNLNRQPTLTVRAGWPLKVLVSKDMILAPYP